MPANMLSIIVHKIQIQINLGRNKKKKKQEKTSNYNNADKW